MRFGERLKFDIRSDDSLNDVLVPPLLVQPLVENSIKHGISSEPLGGSVPDVEVEEEGQLVPYHRHGFRERGLPWRTGDAPGFGLKSIRERLALVYGEVRLSACRRGARRSGSRSHLTDGSDAHPRCCR